MLFVQITVEETRPLQKMAYKRTHSAGPNICTLEDACQKTKIAKAKNN